MNEVKQKKQAKEIKWTQTTTTTKQTTIEKMIKTKTNRD